MNKKKNLNVQLIHTKSLVLFPKILNIHNQYNNGWHKVAFYD